MIKAVTKLIIASAGLWLALPAAAQFEIDPDHFGDPVPTVVQARPEQPKGSMRTARSPKQPQGRRVQALKATKSPSNTLQKLSSSTDVEHHSVSRTSQVEQGSAYRKQNEQSQFARSHHVLEGVPQ